MPTASLDPPSLDVQGYDLRPGVKREPMEADQEERIVRNEVLFRQANEDLRARITLEPTEQRLPFLCECGDSTCTVVVVVSLETYELVRAHPTYFLIAAGHRQLG